jgi:hypothetical protein
MFFVRYEEHEVFDPPEDLDATIWRYVDFTKLVSLLDTKSLFFARADQLGDPFEGSYSRGQRGGTARALRREDSAGKPR